MPEPVFSAEDRVAAPRTVAELPAELRGVTDPIQIATYYTKRENQIRETAQEAIRRGATPPATTPVTRTTDPPETRPFTATETENARQTLIATAKREASIGKKYWERLKTDIEALAARCAPEQLVSSLTWETIYNTLVGSNLPTLEAEAATAAAEATRIASERASAASSAPAATEPLDRRVTEKILPGLGITEDQYRTMQANINATVQKWPLTFDKAGRPRVETDRNALREVANR